MNCTEIKDDTIPHEVITSGKKIASFVEHSGHEVEETTRAEQVEDAIEPKRSAEIGRAHV